MIERTHVVYWCYAADGELLYIGQTGNLERRIPRHKYHHPDWWPLVADIRTTRSTTRRASLRYERMAILSEQPPHNRRSRIAYSHGTLTKYEKGKCRCEACRKAGREARRRSQNTHSEALRSDPTLAEHGRLTTYTNWLCRCELCTAAHADHCARYHAKHPRAVVA